MQTRQKSQQPPAKSPRKAKKRKVDEISKMTRLAGALSKMTRPAGALAAGGAMGSDAKANIKAGDVCRCSPECKLKITPPSKELNQDCQLYLYARAHLGLPGQASSPGPEEVARWRDETVVLMQADDEKKTEAKNEKKDVKKDQNSANSTNFDMDKARRKTIARINKISADNDHSAVKILRKLLTESKQTPKGPWHVFRVYYKHGETDMTTHDTLESLLVDMKDVVKEIRNYELDEEQATDDSLDQDWHPDTLPWVMAKLYHGFECGRILGDNPKEFPDYLSEMISEVIDRSRHLTENQIGWRWDTVIVGGKLLL
jgi:hypothetical protein